MIEYQWEGRVRLLLRLHAHLVIWPLTRAGGGWGGEGMGVNVIGSSLLKHIPYKGLLQCNLLSHTLCKSLRYMHMVYKF